MGSLVSMCECECGEVGGRMTVGSKVYLNRGGNVKRVTAQSGAASL